VIDAVVFDLDGVILETEALWNEVREGLTRGRGGRWSDTAQADMMGMSSTEWSRYLHDELGVPDPPEQIRREVVRQMLERYGESLPLIDGAVDAVRRLATRWPLGLASSANRELIDRALELSGLAPCFRVTVSSEEVERGKPAADVYLEAARRLHVDPARCAAVEDSASGIRSAHAAGMVVVAIPNPDFPPPAEVLALAAVRLDSIQELEPETITEAARLSTASTD
jgi:HAD superfamily hydrolase (TIGR01509 family)